MPEGGLLGRLEARRNAVSMGILLAGFLAACVVYVRAGAPADQGAAPEDSKQYVREMELYGGKANLLAGELREWLGGLWHGRSLAFTLLALSALVAGAVRFALTPTPREGETGAPPDHRRDAPAP